MEKCICTGVSVSKMTWSRCMFIICQYVSLLCWSP